MSLSLNCQSILLKRYQSWILLIGSFIFCLARILLVKAIAAPENFNPELTLPPPPPPEPEPAPVLKPSSEDTAQPQKSTEPFLTLESITPNLNLDSDNFGQQNIVGETTTLLRLRNDDLVRIHNGFNSFAQEEIPTITNIPLYFGWSRERKTYKLTIDGGVDIFNRLPATPYLATQIEMPIFSKVSDEGTLQSLLVFSGAIEHQVYKFNAKTLDHKINFWRFRPSFYWQIAPNFSLFTLGQLGYFNDGNQEFQSFSRLEKKIGEFAIAVNVFTWSFQQDLGETNGYFAPPNFLVYNAEISWEKEIFSFLRCKVSGAIGRQRLRDATDNAYTYQALCVTQISDNLALDLGYTFSNVRDRNTGETSYLNQSFDSQLRWNF